MYSDYDENLRNNIFFREIVEKHSDIIKKASEANWLICIPRSGTVETTEIDINVILDHILVPQEDGILKNYLTCSTLSRKKLKVRKNQIFIDDNQFSCDVINVLFKETFYEEKGKKYTIWCIDKLLYLDLPFNPQSEIRILESLPDCIDFLWVESAGQEILQQIQNLCMKFSENGTNYESEHLQSQKDLIGSLYSQCLQKTLRNILIRDKALKSEQFLEKLKLAVETYMQYCIGKKVLFGINTFMVQSDVYLNKTIRNAEHLEDKDLEISPNYFDAISCGKCELSKLNKALTILDKVNCLDRTFNSLCGNSNGCNIVTSDDLIQMFVFLILRVNIYNWVSNLTFMKDFKFCTSTFTDHVNYLLTTLEAAIEYIKGYHFSKLVKRIDISKENNIFRLVRTGNLKQLKDLFRSSESVESIEKLCHPLCVCENCEQISKSLLTDKEIRNEKEQTLLIYAAFFEKVEIVEYLLNEKVNLNSQDCFGKSALHYACEKGSQDIILLLMSQDSLNVNIVDNNGDTPLHLATSRAQENCVKAIIYSAVTLNTNVCNSSRESPLHLAAKLGYFPIVRILLDNSSSFLSEKEMRSVLTVCHNYSIKNYIEQFSIKKVLPSFAFGSRNYSVDENISLSSSATSFNYGIKPKTADELKKLNLLINAIKNNDFPLTCFYLGFDHTKKQTDFLPKCHPLCDCDECQNINKECTESHEDVEQDDNYKIMSDNSDSFNEEINVNMCNMEGLTPLHIASQYGRTSILRVLLDCGAQVNLQTYKKFYAPLHLACLFQQISIVKELLKCNNCDMNIKDFIGNTPLFYACYKNDCRIIEILLKNDADYDLKNNKSDTVWDICQRKMLYCAFKTLKNNIRYSHVSDK